MARMIVICVACVGIGQFAVLLGSFMLGAFINNGRSHGPIGDWGRDALDDDTQRTIGISSWVLFGIGILCAVLLAKGVV